MAETYRTYNGGLALFPGTAGSVTTQDHRDLWHSLHPNPGTALPAAASTYRGQVRLVQGAAGVADVVYRCVKLADDSYVWQPVGFPYRVYSAVDYGADPYGTNDSAVAINAAFAAADAAGGGVVYLQPGAYKISNYLLMDGISNVTLMGAGVHQTTINCYVTGETAGQNCGILIRNSEYCTLSDFTVDMRKASIADEGVGADQQGIYVARTSGASMYGTRFERLHVKNSWTAGISVINTVVDKLVDLLAQDITVEDCNDWGFITDKFSNVEMHRIRVDNTGNAGVGIYGEQTYHATTEDAFHDNFILDDITAINMAGAITATGLVMHSVRNVNLSNVRAEGNGTGGVTLTIYAYDTINLSNIVCVGNTAGGLVVDLQTAWADADTQWDSRLNMTNIICNDDSGSNGCTLQGVRYATITGFQGRDNATAGLSLNSCQEVLVNGAVVTGNGGYGISINEGYGAGGGHVIGPYIGDGNTFGDLYVDPTVTNACRTVEPFVKTTTGDPAELASSGQVVINTFDNTLKMYAEGAWRTLATSW